MTRSEREDPDVPDSRRGAVIGLVIALLLVVGGLVLIRILHNTARIQDCVMSGRTNCAPADSTTSGN